MNLEQASYFGLTAVPIVYWLVQHARRNGYLPGGLAFLATGLIWVGLVTIHALVPRLAVLVLMAMGGWAATLLFKAGAKDNETSS